ncbi:MAG: PAS domain S-box protein [Planctomycetes bacterium]|nr:PAS domain S-box protein [Planctomycetota bacterium]
MRSLSALHSLFANPTPEAAALLLDVCAQVPGIVFAIGASGKIAFSGGRDIANLPFDSRTTVGHDYRQVLAGHDIALRDIARGLAGEEFETKTEFLGRYFETRYNPLRDGAGVVGLIGIAHDVTNQRRMEQELQQSQTLYRTVIETTDTGFVILDKDGLVVDANDEYLRMTGYEHLEELLGRRVTEWTAPHDLERNAEEVEKCLRFGMTRNLRVDYLDREGRIVPIEVNATYIYVDGEPRILALCRDVSERLRTEETIRRTEERSTSVLEAIADPAVVLDSRGTILAVNEGWRATLRAFSFAQRMNVGPGADYLELFEAAAAEGVRVAAECAAGIRDVLAGRKLQHSMEFAVGEGDEQRWYLKRATRQRDDANTVVVIHVDLTEQKRAQLAIQASERRFRALVELSPVGVFQTDAQGDCVYVNAKWCALAGMEPDRARGRGWADALHPDDRIRVYEQWYRSTHTGEPFALDYRFRDSKGRVTWLHGRAVLIKDDAGNVKGSVGTVDEISDVRVQEIEARRARQGGQVEPPELGRRDRRTGLADARDLLVDLAYRATARSEGRSLALVRMEIDARSLPPGRTTPAERDDALRAIARITTGLLRADDHVAMRGEEGFLLALPGATPAGARACAERVRGAIERSAWLGSAVTVSLGVAHGSDQEGELERLCVVADEQLAAAVRAGGNRVLAPS